MRVGSYSYIMPMVCFLAVSVGFAACSDDIKSQTSSTSTSSGAGGRGEGGAGGAAQQSSSSMASSTAAASTGAGGQAPMTLCEEGCAHADACGLPVCQVAGIDCMAGAQYDCVAKCILDADCKQIATLINLQSDPTKVDPVLYGCLSDCQGGAGGAGGGSTGNCPLCVGTNCQAQVGACNGDMSCQSWLQCVQACQDGPCSDACDQMYAASKALYEPVYSCVCKSCSNDCSAFDPCKNMGAGGGGMGGAGMGGAGMGGAGMGGAGMGGAGGN